MSLIIWSKTKSGNKETFHIAAICHEGYVCNQPLPSKTYSQRAHQVYARLGKTWLPLPADLSEAGCLEICQSCTNQLACLASKTDGNLIKLNQSDLEERSGYQQSDQSSA